jgi:oxalate decarboxylase/phosphoglucose isomerase-like protein (cupin superfamily)
MVEGKRHVSPDEVETQVFDWGTLKWLSTPDVTDARNFSTGIVQLKPGKGHERHNHPDSEEILYVVSGRGDQTVADDEFAVEPGDVVHIPEGVYHSTVNTGWEPLKLVAVYGPPGPEEVLREDPASTILPPGELPE